MDAVEPSRVILAVAPCPSCQREVLTCVDYDAGGDERRLCVHCDAVLESGGVRLADEQELATHDYAFVDEQGCGRPDCGGGRCRG